LKHLSRVNSWDFPNPDSLQHEDDAALCESVGQLDYEGYEKCRKLFCRALIYSGIIICFNENNLFLKN
jgi:hypothetical protein